LKDVALVKLPSHGDKQSLETARHFVAGHTNLLREADSDLIVAGTPLSHASWLELLLPRQPARTEL
jgi:hypothetical protein